MMHYTILGKSECAVSRIGMGCMSLGNDHEENADILHRALANGINYFDTADIYNKGNNEITVGKALKAYRHKVVIATKVGNQWKKDGSGFDWNPSKAHILQSIDESLNRLQTDYVDLYQLHGGTLDDPIDETIDAFETLKKQGKIRFYGISSIRPNVIREYVNRSNITSVMMQYSLLDRRPEESCLELLNENKISVMARGVLAKGLLAGKPSTGFLNYSQAEVAHVQKSIMSLTHTNRSATSLALQFVLHHPAVSCAVVGVRTREQLEDLLNAQQVPLSDEELKILKHAVNTNYYDQHR